MIATSATIGEHALLKVDALTNQRFTVLSRKTQYVNCLLYTSSDNSHHEAHQNDLNYSSEYQYDMYMYAEYGIEW